jgi:hypothetical protein
MAQVKHISSMGGYSRLITMGSMEAERLADKGSSLHTAWVGAEPHYTKLAASRGFLGAKEDATYAAYIGDLMETDARNYNSRVKPPVNFRARFCPPDNAEHGMVWSQQVD